MIGGTLIAANTHWRPSGRRGVAEQVKSSFSVHFRLERVAVFEGTGPNCSGPRIHKVQPALQVRQCTPRIVAENERNGSHPSPRRHVDNRVGGSQQERTGGK